MAHRAKTRRQVVLPIDGRDDLLSADIRGGKGTSLAVMQRLGLRVPPAFTVSTTVMRAYLDTGVLPKRLAHQLTREMEQLERKTGKTFGDPNNPLLVSVRSGAATSMPGMMDTILNLGMTSEVCNGFDERDDVAFGHMLFSRFESGWKDIISTDIPDDPWQQLTEALVAVIRSWDNPRARTYRDHHGIDHTLGTAVNVQAMVYGNRDERSCTGVVFSHDVNSGIRGLYGEFLPSAQGEELVSGKRTPQPFSELKELAPSVFAELEQGVALLSAHERAVVEVEFTVESGALYFLQYRKAKTSTEARITGLVHDIWKKRIPRGEATELIPQEEVNRLSAGKRFDETELAAKVAAGSVMRGIAASPGVACGKIVRFSEDAVECAARGEKVILFRPDTNPDDLPGMLVADAIITLEGGATCHAAVVARSLGKPAVVGASFPTDFAFETVSVDGTAGIAVPGMLPIHECPCTKEVSLFLRWRKPQYRKVLFNTAWAHKRTAVLQNLVYVYMLELLAHEAKGTRHYAEIERERCEWYSDTAELFLCYLVHAVMRELRHVRSTYFVGRLTKQHSLGLEQYGAYKVYDGNKATFVVDEHLDVAAFLRCAVEVFRDYTWDRSFGGPKWATIAETALMFVTGKITHSLFVDRVFDLQHNSGHVFNKHVMVEVDFRLHRVLDEKKYVKTVADFMRYVEHTGSYSWSEAIRSFVRKYSKGGSA